MQTFLRICSFFASHAGPDMSPGEFPILYPKAVSDFLCFLCAAPFPYNGRFPSPLQTDVPGFSLLASGLQKELGWHKGNLSEKYFMECKCENTNTKTNTTRGWYVKISNLQKNITSICFNCKLKYRFGCRFANGWKVCRILLSHCLRYIWSINLGGLLQSRGVDWLLINCAQQGEIFLSQEHCDLDLLGANIWPNMWPWSWC